MVRIGLVLGPADLTSERRFREHNTEHHQPIEDRAKPANLTGHQQETKDHHQHHPQDT